MSHIFSWFHRWRLVVCLAQHSRRELRRQLVHTEGALIIARRIIAEQKKIIERQNKIIEELRR
jgi:hypothetical protein